MELRYVLTRSGDDLFSVAVDAPADAQAMAARLREAGNWIEVIPGIASVVVRFDAATQDSETAQQVLEDLLANEIPALPVPDGLVEIPIVYGGRYGPDLEAVSKATGLSAEKLITAHTAVEHTVDMIGFTPGFAFVSGLDDRFRIARREEPRQRVEAGSVGIADGRTGLYAMASPGGWNIIGRTPYPLFNPNADDPFVLRAGMRVRFKAVTAGEADA
jgi:KipI family sensor histidine kinase inhibitor